MLIRQLKHYCQRATAKYFQTRCYQHSSVYVSTCHNIFYNLALEDWICKNVKFDHRVILMLWRNKPCVVVGRHQNPWAECNLNQADLQGTDVVRRNSGGGTVYHDMGNINITFFTSRKKYNRKENLELIARTMNGFGLHVQINDRDDLVNKGYKISGTAAKLGKDVAYHHCTLLLDVDLAALQSVLVPTLPGIDSKATESIKSPCQNLIDVCPYLNYNNIVDALSESYLAKYGNSQAKFQYVDPANERIFPKLYDSYQELKSWQWRFGKTPKFTIRRAFTHNTTLLEITIEVNKGKIDDIDITVSGDTNASLSSDTIAISTELFATKFWPANVAESLQRVNVSDKNRWLVLCIGAMCNVAGLEQGVDVQL